MAGAATLSDEQIVERVKGGETHLYELILRRYNQRLYRITRSILGDDAEAEDVMQDAYVRAYTHLDTFEGRAKFATWLTKIAVYEALMRKRRQRRMEELDVNAPGALPDPERQALDEEVSRKLEGAVDALPAPYRAVFVMRDMEELTTAEVSEALGISTTAVKIRLHRARAALRRILGEDFGSDALKAYAFHASRCDRVVAAVFERIL